MASLPSACFTGLDPPLFLSTYDSGGDDSQDRKGLKTDCFQTNNHRAMSNDDLKDTIKSIMVESLMLKTPKEEIADDLPLFGPEGLGLDSIDALELVVSLEKNFGVTVPNSDVARTALATVNSIHDYVVAHRTK